MSLIWMFQYMLKFGFCPDILSEIFTESRPGQFIIILENWHNSFLCKNKAPRKKYEKTTTLRENQNNYIHFSRSFNFLYLFNIVIHGKNPQIHICYY